MTNNKQNSVEWLIGQLKISTYWNTLIAELEFMDLEIDDIIEQAKAMHKEEVEQFASQCVIEHLKGNPKLINEYYNETFGGNNE